jgi:hypothetical protein
MTGELNLGVLLATMEPVLEKAPWGFGLLPDGQVPPPEAFALIREAEGITVIALMDVLAERGIPAEGQWARITLTVHSALAAVGLTSAVATALTREGIPANVVAGYFHDHLFVPWDRRDAAMAALRGLSGR